MRYILHAYIKVSTTKHTDFENNDMNNAQILSESIMHDSEDMSAYAQTNHVLFDALLPIWADQLMAARETTNHAIANLSERFHDLSSRIAATANNAAGHDQSNDLVSLLQESQSQLASVIALLRQAVDDKKVMVDAIVELADKSKELYGLANVVNSIARETNLVAINAAIEAAHIGQQGRGFAVVAGAVRRLAAEAGDTGKNIAEVVTKVTKAINKVEAISHANEEKDTTMLTDAEQVVEGVVHKFGDAVHHMQSSAEAMQQQSQHIQHEIADVLVSLQFQDRVSQMITHVHDDIYKLHDQVYDSDAIDVQSWLDALAATYTTKEQHLIHQGKPYQISTISAPAHKSNVTENSADEITFF